MSMRIREYMEIASTFRFKLVHSSVLALLLVANFFKWLVFGRLTPHEIKTLREKAGHTTWEFVFGFLVFYNSTGNLLDIYTEAIKFAGLFLCVWLVKCFHYLTADRVHSAYTATDAAGHVYGHFLIPRLGLGILCLNLVDGLLIYQYWHDIIMKNYASHNVLITIFGFEIMNHVPVLLSTSLQFVLNTYEVLAVSPSSPELFKQWKLRKVKTMFVAEFAFNLLRLTMSFVFSILFLYYYTVPVHMLPTAYNSLKIAVLKTRLFVDFKKRQLLLMKLKIPRATFPEKCIICYEELDDTGLQDIRVVPLCGHIFHFECIQLWIDYLSSCPICRDKI